MYSVHKSKISKVFQIFELRKMTGNIETNPYIEKGRRHFSWNSPPWKLFEMLSTNIASILWSISKKLCCIFGRSCTSVNLLKLVWLRLEKLRKIITDANFAIPCQFPTEIEILPFLISLSLLFYPLLTRTVLQCKIDLLFVSSSVCYEERKVKIHSQKCGKIVV